MIYLNNGATSFPKPKQVIDAVNSCLLSPPLHSSRTGIEREPEDLVYGCRQSLARLFNIEDPLRIVFTSGSTEALNLVIKGLNLDGTHVVTTAIEHNSVLRPLKTMELEGRISISIVGCDETGYVEPDWIEQAITPGTSLVVINHSSNVTSTTLDVKAITSIAHKHDCLVLVDCSQSAGAIPIDIKDWDVDFMAFTGHKSLFGIQGTGGLFIKDEEELSPLKVGGTGSLSEVLIQPDGMPIHFEAGTPNTPGILALKAGVEFVMETGLENIRAHKKKLLDIMFAELKDNPKIHIYHSREHNGFANFCFNVEGIVPEEVGYILDSSFDIVVRTGLHCAPLLLQPLGVHPWGTVRATPSYFTTDDEIGKFIDAVRQVSNFVKG